MIYILGAIMNHVRGGFLTVLVTEYYYMRKYNDTYEVAVVKAEKIFKSLGKNLNDFVYALTFSIYLSVPVSWKGSLIFIIYFLAMRAGRSFGWGGYITSMIKKKVPHDRDDVKILDKWFRGNDEPVLSGWAALSFRGLMWTSLLYLGFLLSTLLGMDFPSTYHYIPLVGLSMGSIYLLSMKLGELITTRGNGWQFGELYFGAALWGGTGYLLGI